MISGSCCSVELNLITAAHGLLGCMITIESYSTLGSIKLIVFFSYITYIITLHIYITYIYIWWIFPFRHCLMTSWRLLHHGVHMDFFSLPLLGSAVPTIYPNFWRFKWADWMGCFIFCFKRIFYYPTNSSIFVAGYLRLAMFGYIYIVDNHYSIL